MTRDGSREAGSDDGRGRRQTRRGGASALPETGVVLPASDLSPTDRVAFAVDAERAGAGSVWCAEGWGDSPFVTLGRVSEATDCWLGTGIANAFARTPGALAMHAASLHEATGGRFALGIGASTPSIVEGFHGVSYDRPLRRVRETIEVLRRAFAGDPLAYDGAVFDPDGYALDRVGDGGGDRIDVPVCNAALGPTNVEMTVAYADGIVTYLLPFDRIAAALDSGAERAGVDADLHVIAQAPVCASADPGKARAVLARHLAYYVGALDVYRDVVSRHGFAAEATRIHEAWAGGDREAARAAVTDDLMDAVGFVGTPERVREGVDDALAGAVDTVLFSFPDGVDAEMRHAALSVFDA